MTLALAQREIEFILVKKRQVVFRRLLEPRPLGSFTKGSVGQSAERVLVGRWAHHFVCDVKKRAEFPLSAL